VLAVTALAVAGSAAAGSSGIGAATVGSAANHPCVVAVGSGDQPFVRDFNPYHSFGNVGADFTAGGIYENLVITTAFGGGHQYNVLAKSLDWSKDGKTLTITVNPNAKWSDGKPVTNQDVLYSLTIGKVNKTLDHIGLVSDNSNIKAVKLAGPGKVQIVLNQTDSTFVGSTLPNVWIVPKAIFSKAGDLTKWKNPNPVGSGPFTVVKRFTPQDYVLAKNPHYWQAGLPKVQCIERVAAASNDAALLQLVNGDADWSHNFYPNVEGVYQSKDPAHYHNSYLTASLPVGLFFDTTQYPYSIPAFRKAVSLAINRKDVSKLGEYGYAPPLSAVGIELLYPKWVDPSLMAQARALATYDPTGAKKVLTDAGFTYKGGNLFDPKGNKVSFQIHVIGGWSDWVASIQIIVRNLQAIGMDASMKLEPDWGAWQPGAMSTKFVTLLWTYGSQDPTPWAYFYSILDPSQNVGSGNDASATGNWMHYSSAAAGSLLKQFKGTLDVTKQKQLASKLEALFLNDLPFVPIFSGPRWSTYSTKYFTGFPTWKNQYVDPIWTTWTQEEQILLSLRPAS
jgi:peptide/nickel transport system substrate-binding protein